MEKSFTEPFDVHSVENSNLPKFDILGLLDFNPGDSDYYIDLDEKREKHLRKIDFVPEDLHISRGITEHVQSTENSEENVDNGRSRYQDELTSCVEGFNHSEPNNESSEGDTSRTEDLQKIGKAPVGGGDYEPEDCMVNEGIVEEVEVLVPYCLPSFDGIELAQVKERRQHGIGGNLPSFVNINLWQVGKKLRRICDEIAFMFKKMELKKYYGFLTHDREQRNDAVTNSLQCPLHGNIEFSPDYDDDPGDRYTRSNSGEGRKGEGRGQTLRSYRIYSGSRFLLSTMIMTMLFGFISTAYVSDMGRAQYDRHYHRPSILGNYGCQPVDMLVMLDGTNHMTPELNDLQTTLLLKVIHTIPEGSKISALRVGETSFDIVLYKQKDDNSIEKSLKIFGHQPALGNVISGPYIQTEIPKYFMDSPLTNNRSQIVILMTSNNVDDFSFNVVESIRKRKTFVIGLGTTELSKHLKEIAANEDHVSFVTELSDIEDLVYGLNELICTDSTYLCDTDHFNICNRKQCNQSSRKYTSTIQSSSPSCNKYCPYYNDTLYHTYKKICCENHLDDLYEEDGERSCKRECYNNRIYVSEKEEIICHTEKLTKKSPSNTKICGDTSYDPTKESCCEDIEKVLNRTSFSNYDTDLRNRDNIACHKGGLYDMDKFYFHKGGDQYQSQMIPIGRLPCGNSSFSSLDTDTCCGDMVIKKAKKDKFCCNGGTHRKAVHLLEKNMLYLHHESCPPEKYQPTKRECILGCRLFENKQPPSNSVILKEGNTTARAIVCCKKEFFTHSGVQFFVVGEAEDYNPYPRFTSQMSDVSKDVPNKGELDSTYSHETDGIQFGREKGFETATVLDVKNKEKIEMEKSDLQGGMIIDEMTILIITVFVILIMILVLMHKCGSEKYKCVTNVSEISNFVEEEEIETDIQQTSDVKTCEQLGTFNRRAISDSEGDGPQPIPLEPNGGETIFISQQKLYNGIDKTPHHHQLNVNRHGRSVSDDINHPNHYDIPNECDKQTAKGHHICDAKNNDQIEGDKETKDEGKSSRIFTKELLVYILLLLVVWCLKSSLEKKIALGEVKECDKCVMVCSPGVFKQSCSRYCKPFCDNKSSKKTTDIIGCLQIFIALTLIIRCLQIFIALTLLMRIHGSAFEEEMYGYRNKKNETSNENVHSCSKQPLAYKIAEMIEILFQYFFNNSLIEKIVKDVNTMLLLDDDFLNLNTTCNNTKTCFGNNLNQKSRLVRKDSCCREDNETKQLNINVDNKNWDLRNNMDTGNGTNNLNIPVTQHEDSDNKITTLRTVGRGFECTSNNPQLHEEPSLCVVENSTKGSYDNSDNDIQQILAESGTDDESKETELPFSVGEHTANVGNKQDIDEECTSDDLQQYEDLNEFVIKDYIWVSDDTPDIDMQLTRSGTDGLDKEYHTDLPATVTEHIADATVNKTTDLSLVEALRMDRQSIELYKQMLTEGKQAVPTMRVMVVGQFGIGKTSLTRRLLTKYFNTDTYEETKYNYRTTTLSSITKSKKRGCLLIVQTRAEKKKKHDSEYVDEDTIGKYFAHKESKDETILVTANTEKKKRIFSKVEAIGIAGTDLQIGTLKELEIEGVVTIRPNFFGLDEIDLKQKSDITKATSRAINFNKFDDECKDAKIEEEEAATCVDNLHKYSIKDVLKVPKWKPVVKKFTYKLPTIKQMDNADAPCKISSDKEQGEHMISTTKEMDGENENIRAKKATEDTVYKELEKLLEKARDREAQSTNNDKDTQEGAGNADHVETGAGQTEDDKSGIAISTESSETEFSTHPKEAKVVYLKYGDMDLKTKSSKTTARKRTENSPIVPPSYKEKVMMLRDLTWRARPLPVPKVEIAVLRVFEPLMNILGQLPTEDPPGPEITMRYELLRVCTLRNYPKHDKPYIIRLAGAGFYYAAEGDEVVCYTCGMRRHDWVEADVPMDIHKRIAPNCRFLTKNDEVNVPVPRADGPEVNKFAFLDEPGSANVLTAQHNSNRPSEDVSSDVTSSLAEHMGLAPQRQRRPGNFVRDNGQSQVVTANTRMTTVEGVNRVQPKHPDYAIKARRISSFQGWPDNLHQTPEILSDAGFYFAGVGDAVRCFFCGIGLRHWAEEDNPWIEHARWSRHCVYLKQLKGEEFINLVHMAVQYTQENDEQTASTPGTGNQLPTDELERLLLTDAAQSVLEVGYQPRIIKKAIEIVVREHGRDGFNSQRIIEKVIEIEEAEDAANIANNLQQMNLSNQTSDTTRSENTTEAEPQNTSLPSASASAAASAPTSAPASNIREVTSTQQPTNPTAELKAAAANNPSDQGATGLQDKKSKKETERYHPDSKSIKAENEKLKEQTVCKICLDNTVCIVFLPCGHLVTCAECAPAMRKCPMCRSLVKGTVKTFMA